MVASQSAAVAIKSYICDDSSPIVDDDDDADVAIAAAIPPPSPAPIRSVMLAMPAKLCVNEWRRKSQLRRNTLPQAMQ